MIQRTLPALCLLAATLRPALGLALDGPSDNQVQQVRPVPKPGIEVPAADAAELEPHRELLATLCILSDLKVVGEPGRTEIAASAEKSSHAKCERCWNLRPSVGTDAEHPTLCSRCATVIRATSGR